MIQNIRLNTFETNSSSTHAMVIIEGEEQNNLWNEGKLYADWDGTLYSEEEVKANFEAEKEDYIKNHAYSEEDSDDEGYIFNEWLNYSNLYNCDNWYENLESECNTYTTKSGDTIYIHCAYGQDY